MSWKEEYIKKYGEVAWAKQLERNRQWRLDNPEKTRENNRNWRLNNPERQRENHRNWRLNNPENAKKLHEEESRKGGRYYLNALKHARNGIPGRKNEIRSRDRRDWFEYKKIIAPDSEIHHEWIPGTADFRGVALVESDQHRYGSIDVIQILDGEITAFTEKEIQEREHVNR